MTLENTKLQLEERAYKNFQKLWQIGSFEGQRYGQAFYSHFQLERLENQAKLFGLYAAADDTAKSIIQRIFEFN